MEPGCGGGGRGGPLPVGAPAPGPGGGAATAPPLELLLGGGCGTGPLGGRGGIDEPADVGAPTVGDMDRVEEPDGEGAGRVDGVVEAGEVAATPSGPDVALAASKA